MLAYGSTLDELHFCAWFNWMGSNTLFFVGGYLIGCL